MQRMRRLFQNRYGVDQLSLAILIGGALVSLLFGWFGAPRICSLLYFVSLGLAVGRCLSRNLYARALENRRYLDFTRRVRGHLALRWRMLCECRTSRYLRCPACSQMLRLPRGKGKVEIHCNRCHHHFLRKV